MESGILDFGILVTCYLRYLSSVNKGDVEVLDLPAGDVDYLLAIFFCTEQILQG